MENITNLKTWLVISIFLVVPELSTPALASPDSVLAYDDGTSEIYVMIHQSQYLRQRFLVNDFGLSGDYLVKTVQINWSPGLPPEDFAGEIKLRDYDTGNVVTAASFTPPASGWYDYDVSGSGFVSDHFYVELWQTGGFSYIGADTAPPHHEMSEVSTNSGANWHVSALEMDFNFMVRALVVPASAVGRTIYVDDDANGANDANDGSSWADAYWCLQDALADAQSGDEIRVAQGTYRPNEGLKAVPEFNWRTATFQLINGVAIKGGYAGFGETDPDARDIEAYRTILSGDLNGNDGPNFANNDENSYHVVTGSGTDETAVLDGLTITAGYANGFGNPNDSGGGMYNTSGSPTVINCTFSKNSAVYAGGMANRDYCSPTLINCRFVGNSVHSGGAGIYSWKSSGTTLIDCTFSGNFGRYGAAMRTYDSDSTLTNCVFSGNFAREYGGAIYLESSNSELSSLKLTNCTFSGNSAGLFTGGGIFNHEGDSSLTLTNCIFWNNSDSGGVDESAQIHGGTPVVNYCCIQGWTGTWAGLGNMGANPMFARNPDDGGDDWGVGNRKEFGDLLSIGRNDDFGDLHLRSQAGRRDTNSQSWIQDDVTSSCIDAGDMSSPIGHEPFPNGGVINMGAYGGSSQASKSYFGEPVCETIVAGDINGDCKVDSKDFLILIYHWLGEE